MKAETETLNLWLIWENPRSLFVCTAASNPPRKLHLPRSLIDRLTKFPKPAEPMFGYQPIELTLPAWKIEQEQLWDFVRN